MKWEELRPGMPVMIAEGHDSGFGGRCGSVIAVGTFRPCAQISAIVDFGDVSPAEIEPEGLHLPTQ